ncbi:MAG TPA: lytic transglycosylase domain-containing protein [Rhodocyclaceae bacterium]|nr:lytic transglycosylase domain-containing protein [Rhodocyclaceae bacterium]
MRAPIELCFVLGALAALPAGAAERVSPYRLTVDPADYRLRLPGEPAKPGKSRKGGDSRLSALVARHARARGLDPALVEAVVRAESAYRSQAVSPKGAVGLMQVMPDTGRRFGISDLADPDGNLRAGTAYLGYLLDLFGDLPLALAAYNAGEGAVLRHGRSIPPYPETQAYVRGILGAYGAVHSPARRLYLPGTRLESRDLAPYRLRRNPWTDEAG